MSLSNICLLCESPIFYRHGNRRYHKRCSRDAKNQRSRNRYAKDKMELDPFWLNEKILRTHYNEFDKMKEIVPSDLERIGFVLDNFSTIKYINSDIVFMMHDFGFSILNNKNIIIWKIF